MPYDLTLPIHNKLRLKLVHITNYHCIRPVHKACYLRAARKLINQQYHLPYIVKLSVSEPRMIPLSVTLLKSYLIPVTEMILVLTDTNILLSLADINAIPVINSLPSSRPYITGLLSLNITFKEVSTRFPSTEQVIFLCVKMGRYKGPGGSIVTIE